MARLSMYLACCICIAVLLGSSCVRAQPVASPKRLQCTKCRYISSDFPIFAKCKGETEGENGYCCKSSSATDDCYARDLAHGGYSCDETYRSTGAINAHCCYSCT